VEESSAFEMIHNLSPEIEDRVVRNPLLNIDTFVIPSPYIHNPSVQKDYGHSYVWVEEGEILGYILVYSDPDRTEFLIYKIVTSPFGRGRGIGTSFIEHLARNIDEDASVYIYIWEKQADTVEFFQNKGFEPESVIVYRKLVYHRLVSCCGMILKKAAEGNKRRLGSEEIGKTRHDARKVVRLLSSMVDALGTENSGKIVEDINRESTTLMNILNSFRDSMKIIHEVDLLELIFERIVPYVQGSKIRCELRLHLDTGAPTIQGYYVNIGRALVNIVSNALDAIEEVGRKGIIDILLRETGDYLTLTIADNGAGMSDELLVRNTRGVPKFVGHTTKGNKTGEGLGTQQIYSTFGAENIEVTSLIGQGTSWNIRFPKQSESIDTWFVRMNRRYNEFKDLWEVAMVGPKTPRREVVSYIWQIRKIEIFLFDLILRFSRYHNIRDIYRSILGFLQGTKTETELEEEIAGYRSDIEKLKFWLFDISREIRRRTEILKDSVDVDSYWSSLFRSYGQAYRNVIIFTVDPETGEFLATDRKLAEHLDFVPYLNRDKDQLLRGEFLGDLNIDEKPVHFGIWSISSMPDALQKLQMIRRGAQTFLEKGIHPEKRLAFYHTTYVQGEYDLDINKTSTFGEFSRMSDEELKQFITQTDNEMEGYLLGRE
jgi:GNAT superfamily N-acetyltransferase/two-component sensor histidine kinase